MKAKKRDGGERDVPTHQTKNEPKETLKKLIRKYVVQTTKAFEEQQASK